MKTLRSEEETEFRGGGKKVKMTRLGASSGDIEMEIMCPGSTESHNKERSIAFVGKERGIADAAGQPQTWGGILLSAPATDPETTKFLKRIAQNFE